MYGRRRYRNYRRSYGSKAKYTVKYISDNVNFIDFGTETPRSIARYQGNYIIVPSVDDFGVRKAKHFYISFSTITKFTFALVYVPHGYAPNLLNTVGYSPELYVPSNNVVMAGEVDPDAKTSFGIHVSRNLRDGDAIYLMCSAASDLTDVNFSCKYAITS